MTEPSTEAKGPPAATTGSHSWSPFRDEFDAVLEPLATANRPDAVPAWPPGSDRAPAGPPAPSADVVETERSYEIKVDLPGFDEKNVEVLLSGNSLTLKRPRSPKSGRTSRPTTTSASAAAAPAGACSACPTASTGRRSRPRSTRACWWSPCPKPRRPSRRATARSPSTSRSEGAGRANSPPSRATPVHLPKGIPRISTATTAGYLSSQAAHRGTKKMLATDPNPIVTSRSPQSSARRAAAGHAVGAGRPQATATPMQRTSAGRRSCARATPPTTGTRWSPGWPAPASCWPTAGA